MTDQLSWSAVDELLAGFAPEGPLRTAVLLVYGVCVAVAPFIYRYYLGVLAQGAAPEGSLERQDYDKLRAGLAGGNLAARLYAKWLTAFLDGVERFFGDAGLADRTLFPRAFGLKTPAPLWTAPAFDRCLLLALIYPFVTIYVIWGVSGRVGPAESALGLFPDVPGWRRGLEAIAVGFAGFVLWRFTQTSSFKRLILVAIGAFIAPSVAVAYSASPDTARALMLVGAFAFAGSGSGIFAVALIYPLFFVILAGSIVSSAILTSPNDVSTICMKFFILAPLVVLIGVVLIGMGVARVRLLPRAITLKRHWQGAFFLLFLVAMIVACLVAAQFLSSIEGRRSPFTGILLFVCLLTLLNAPFDWASLGLTRALLRRGLELGGWWPYLLALVDACLAGVIIAFLALTMVIGVQAFDELAVHGGGEKAAVLPLPALFDGIAKNPAAPEYWWAYALLLSSMITLRA